MHPDGYEKSQFYFHLAQNLKARKIITKQDIKKDMPQVMKMDIILERTNMKMC